VSEVYAISNGITIGNNWDFASPELAEHAIRKGWCKNPDDFHFARCYSDLLYTKFSYCKERRARTTELLSAGMGNLTASERRDLSDRCFSEANSTEKDWLERITGVSVKRTNSLPYRIAWNGFNKTAEMPDIRKPST